MACQNTYIVIVVVVNRKTENLFKVDIKICPDVAKTSGGTGGTSGINKSLEISIFSSAGVSLEIINYFLLAL